MAAPRLARLRSLDPARCLGVQRGVRSGIPQIRQAAREIGRLRGSEEALELAVTPLGNQHALEPKQRSPTALDPRREVLDGEPPFTGATAQAILARKLTKRPRSLRTGRPDVPHGVERAVLLALEKDRAKRPASAGFLIEMLS